MFPFIHNPFHFHEDSKESMKTNTSHTSEPSDALMFSVSYTYYDKQPESTERSETVKTISLLKNGKLHSLDSPAYKEFYENGNPSKFEWYKDGVLFCSTHPSRITFSEDGKIFVKSWIVNGQFHRADGPAYMVVKTNRRKSILEIWYKFGKIHNSNGPAYQEWTNNGKIKVRKWYCEDKLHNTHGPAYLEFYPDGRTKFLVWYENGVFNREHGPAIIKWDENSKLKNQVWFKEGVQYRSEGPSLRSY